jgi:hypothetical protein
MQNVKFHCFLSIVSSGTLKPYMGVLYQNERQFYSHYSVLANLKIMNLILEVENTATLKTDSVNPSYYIYSLSRSQRDFAT